MIRTRHYVHDTGDHECGDLFPPYPNTADDSRSEQTHDADDVARGCRVLHSCIKNIRSVSTLADPSAIPTFTKREKKTSFVAKKMFGSSSEQRSNSKPKD